MLSTLVLAALSPVTSTRLSANIAFLGATAAAVFPALRRVRGLVRPVRRDGRQRRWTDVGASADRLHRDGHQGSNLCQLVDDGRLCDFCLSGAGRPRLTRLRHRDTDGLGRNRGRVFWGDGD